VRRRRHNVRVRERARPRIIIGRRLGLSAPLDYADFRAIANEVGAYLMVTWRNFAEPRRRGCASEPVPARARR